MSRATLTLEAVYDPTVSPRTLLAAAFSALITQGAFGRDTAGGMCQYRTQPATTEDPTDAQVAAGLACVVGQLMPDDVYDPECEGMGPEELAPWFAARTGVPRFLLNAEGAAKAQHKMRLLIAAQKIHDGAASYGPTAPQMRSALLRACDREHNAGLDTSLDNGTITEHDVAEVRAVLESLS